MATTQTQDWLTFRDVETFGPAFRFRISTVTSLRFEGEWFHVEDAEVLDEFGLPSLIRQTATDKATRHEVMAEVVEAHQDAFTEI